MQPSQQHNSCTSTAVVAIPDKLPASDLFHHQRNAQQDRTRQLPASTQAPDLLSARARSLVGPDCGMDAGQHPHFLLLTFMLHSCMYTRLVYPVLSVVCTSSRHVDSAYIGP